MVMLNLMDKSQEAFNFEMRADDDFSSVLRRYMDEQNISINDLAKRSNISRRTVIRYRSGHMPNDYITLVMLCIGLKINISKAEYLFKLAHLSLGTDIVNIP